MVYYYSFSLFKHTLNIQFAVNAARVQISADLRSVFCSRYRQAFFLHEEKRSFTVGERAEVQSF